jgi:hypothetical protein
MPRVYSDQIWILHFPKALDPDPDVKVVLLLIIKNVKKIIFEDFSSQFFAKLGGSFSTCIRIRIHTNPEPFQIRSPEKMWMIVAHRTD